MRCILLECIRIFVPCFSLPFYQSKASTVIGQADKLLSHCVHRRHASKIPNYIRWRQNNNDCVFVDAADFDFYFPNTSICILQTFRICFS